MGNLLKRIEYNQRLAEQRAPEKKRPTKREIEKLKESIEKIPRTEPLPIVTRDVPAEDQKRRGRPAAGPAKEVLTIRLDPELIMAIKGTGKSWPILVRDVLYSQFLPGPR